MKIALLATVLTTALGLADATQITLVKSGNNYQKIVHGNDGANTHFYGPFDGCHYPGPYWLVEFCMDTGNGRAHIKYRDPPGLKKCFRFRKPNTYSLYDEAPCDW